MSRYKTLKTRSNGAARDEFGRSLRGRAQWKAAETFEQAAQLTALFVEGTLGFFPGHFKSNLCAESIPLVPHLAALNRAGFLTTVSQPGFLQGNVIKQRSFVEGLVKDYDLAGKINRLALISDLYILVCRRGTAAGIKLPVTIDDFKASGFSGEAWSDTDDDYTFGIDNFKELYNEKLFRNLADTYYVCLIDLCWGRTDYLWKVLTEELCVDFVQDD